MECIARTYWLCNEKGHHYGNRMSKTQIFPVSIVKYSLWTHKCKEKYKKDSLVKQAMEKKFVKFLVRFMRIEKFIGSYLLFRPIAHLIHQKWVNFLN